MIADGTLPPAKTEQESMSELQLYMNKQAEVATTLSGKLDRDLQGLSADELQQRINEIYARHGYYSEPADDPDLNKLNPDEQRNVLRFRFA